jgi:hypothetical protein
LSFFWGKDWGALGGFRGVEAMVTDGEKFAKVD